MIEAITEVTEQSGEKSGILSEEKDMGERSNNIKINKYDSSLRTFFSHSHG